MTQEVGFAAFFFINLAPLWGHKHLKAPGLKKAAFPSFRMHSLLIWKSSKPNFQKVHGNEVTAVQVASWHWPLCKLRAYSFFPAPQSLLLKSRKLFQRPSNTAWLTLNANEEKSQELIKEKWNLRTKCRLPKWTKGHSLWGHVSGSQGAKLLPWMFI